MVASFAPRGLPPELPQPRGPNPENWFEEYVTRNWGVPRLRLQLELVYADGSSALVTSDEAWRATAEGPIRANNEYDGEVYDARRETPGWLRPGFDDSAWSAARILTAPSGALVAQAIEPVRVVESLAAVSVEQTMPGRWIVDVGQVIYGRPHVRVRGPRGASLEIRSASTRWPDGRLRVEDNRAAQNTDVYVLAGSAEEAWAPAFRGQAFRYIQITAPADVELIGASADVLSTDCRPVGTFTCSDPILNQLASNIRNSHRSFRRSVPMDPDRDERQGWMGDHQKAQRERCLLLRRRRAVSEVARRHRLGAAPLTAAAELAAGVLARDNDVDLIWPAWCHSWPSGSTTVTRTCPSSAACTSRSSAGWRSPRRSAGRTAPGTATMATGATRRRSATGRSAPAARRRGR
jgi:alpha-L-rhamnosidase